ncbi:MAG: hypothetical protein AAB451_03375 [Patescibacteria group bacterium]
MNSSKFIKVNCKNCGKIFSKDKGHYAENLKLGHNFYCSRKCEYQYKSKKQTLTCENCGKNFERTPHAISPHNYCSSTCAAIVNNKKCLKGHAKIKPKLKICTECGEKYKKNTNNIKYCSLVCRRKAEWYTPKDLLGIIRNAVQKLKRTPARRELKNINDSCRKVFGSWNNAVLAAGFTPNRSHDNRMYKRADAKAFDGHLCDSISELLIDNWLYKNNIPHERDAHYPETHHKADWEISLGSQKIFVEYFGLANDSPRYDRAVKEKMGLCNKHKISLISIYPKDIYPKIFLEENLKNKFKNFLTI